MWTHDRQQRHFRIPQYIVNSGRRFDESAGGGGGGGGKGEGKATAYKKCSANSYEFYTRPVRGSHEREQCTCHLTGSTCNEGECVLAATYVECDAKVCAVGSRCGNQRIAKRAYAATAVFKTPDGRGRGLRASEDIKQGQLIVEYCGELIDGDEMRRRLSADEEKGEFDFYYFQVDNEMTIDAGPKGNKARFVNHSCEPNCQAQKWLVGDEYRVGIFALEDIVAGTEFTYDYNFEGFWKLGQALQCRCGAELCRGTLGGKKKKKGEKVTPPAKKKRKRSGGKQKAAATASDDAAPSVSVVDGDVAEGVEGGETPAKRTRTSPLLSVYPVSSSAGDDEVKEGDESPLCEPAAGTLAAAMKSMAAPVKLDDSDLLEKKALVAVPSPVTLDASEGKDSL
jgi:hypothetical protein